MSYPQPDSNAPALAGGDFFRLKTELVSAGDIYESEQGAHAFAIGPDSDIANVAVYYYSNQSTTSRLTSAHVGPLREFRGLVSARMDQDYPLSTRRGRTLICPADMYNPSWRPSVFGGGDTITFVTPVLDVIQYLSPPPSITPRRPDKTFQFASFNQAPLTGRYWLVLPAYGRKSASFTWKNGSGATGVSLNVALFGVRLSGYTPSVNYTDNGNTEVNLVASTSVGAIGQLLFNFKSSANGDFDYFAISYDRTAGTDLTGFTTSVIVSDEEI